MSEVSEMKIFESRKEYKAAVAKAKAVLKSGGLSDSEADRYLGVCDELEVRLIIRKAAKIINMIRGKEPEESETLLDYYLTV